MSSSGRRRFLMRHPVVVDLGCSCRRSKLSSLFSFRARKPKPNPNPKPCSSPKHHHHRHDHPLSSYYPFSAPSATTSFTSSWETGRHPSSISTTATSPYDEAMHESVEGGGKGRVGESVALVKESDNPYMDFRQSMLQMILEKEIYAWEELQELLSSFLALNAPCHHDVIVRAFTEIWSGAFFSDAGSSGLAGAGSYGKSAKQRGYAGGGRRRRRHPPCDA